MLSPAHSLQRFFTSLCLVSQCVATAAYAGQSSEHSLSVASISDNQTLFIVNDGAEIPHRGRHGATAPGMDTGAYAAASQRAQGLVSETYVFKDAVDSLTIPVAAKVSIRQTAGPLTKVTLTTEPKLQPVLAPHLEQGTLSILAPTRPFKASTLPVVDVTVPDVGKVRVTGGASVALAGIQGEHLAIAASKGASVSASGALQSFHVEADSGAQVDLNRVTALYADIVAAHGSQVTARVTRQISLEAASGAGIDITGHPRVTKNDTDRDARVTIR